MNPKITIGTVCFMKNIENNQVLFLKRKNEPMQNLYTGVGGKTKPEEDVMESCIREIKEETGLDAKELKLKGIIKTILDENKSCWILYVYTCSNFSGSLIQCNEGDLKWFNQEKINQLQLIGFIKEIIGSVLKYETIIEGTIWHDMNGNVLQKELRSIV